MATIHDVAHRAGVSTSTVSHVINDTRFVSDETRTRVLQAINELSYQPNRVARSLRARRTHTLGVLLPNSANPFFADMLLGVEAVAYDHGYSVIFGNAIEDPQRELSYLEVLLATQVDGILLISTGIFNEALKTVSARDVPVVLVDRSTEQLGVDSVLTDNAYGGALATQHLLSLGHRRIGCITGPPELIPMAFRIDGYRRAMAEAGVEVDETLIVNGDFQHESGYNGCRKLLSHPEPPTAIFVFNDLMAVGALCALHEAGLRVPEDVSVIGYDNVPLASYTVPRLTTIGQPSQMMGRMATEMLVSRVKNPDLPPRHQLLDVTLIERASCGPLHNRD
ncbi:MAG: LacI family DNA-binding transcriptional regulator [Burkholderiales bacterium]|nr:LacI family DNA-binding transcriptional regulator [Anaerolineae bacterium]